MITAMILLCAVLMLIWASTMFHSASQFATRNLMKVPQRGLGDPTDQTTNVQLHQWVHKHGYVRLGSLKRLSQTEPQ